MFLISNWCIANRLFYVVKPCYLNNTVLIAPVNVYFASSPLKNPLAVTRVYGRETWWILFSVRLSEYLLFIIYSRIIFIFRMPHIFPTINCFSIGICTGVVVKLCTQGWVFRSSNPVSTFFLWMMLLNHWLCIHFFCQIHF